MPPPDANADPAVEFVSEPERLSKTALAALAAGLLSCLPLVGMLAAVTGVAALHRIGRSRGRLGGRTFAAVGMTFGLISTALWLSVILGVRQEYANYTTQFVKPAAAYFGHVEKGEWAECRGVFEASAAPGDGECAEFARRLGESAGRMTGPIDTLGDFWTVRTPATKIPPLRLGREYTVWPVRFERGIAFVMLRMAEGRPDPKNRFPTEGVDEITVVTQQGEVVRLSAPEKPAPEKNP